MHDSVNRKLLCRELNGNTGCSSVKSLYGSRAWVDNLDIVNELCGHTGCVNAISWSHNGYLLASGSDDTQINIHTTVPDFALNTRIDSGHTENIFSVKFMPHSGDRTIISAAGDSEVRIFDIEYAPISSSTSSSSTSAAGPPRLSTGPRPFLSTHRRGMDTSEVAPQKLYSHRSDPHKVYKSHTDRVKRIVTESSPHVFLTCSEDGTVRQFDLRQPSSSYTRIPARSSQRSYFGVTLTSVDLLEEEDNRNPPLISYRRHQIDLNTISCSTSQPHYIALGGAHPHCFLHDRRMLGRDLGQESGSGASSSDSELSAATRCVRRFASRPAKDGDYQGNPHITACKISDANPNDVVVSWSGGDIYLFDINHSPEPNEKGLGRGPWDPTERNTRARRDHGRRHAGGEPRSKRRRAESSSDTESEAILPGNGMIKISGLVVDLRKEIFGMKSSEIPASPDLALRPEELEKEKKKSWDAALVTAHVLLKRINHDIEDLDEKDLEYFDKNEGSTSVEFRRERSVRRTLARNRRRTRMFVKAAGCLARALGGFVEGIGLGAESFLNVGMGSTFKYKLLHVVISFLDGGSEAVEELAKEEQESIQDEDDEVLDAGDLDRFFHILESEASNDTVRGVDTNEEIFESEKGMVRAFKGAVELGRDHAMTSMLSVEQEVDGSRSAKRFWGERVGRAILMKEGEGIDFAFAESAFGDMGGEGDDDDGDDGDDDDDSYPPVLQEMGDDESEEEGESEEYGLGKTKEEIEPQAPIWEHTKIYSGHCNVKTVKDVNFYGMDDEYVVSGSDCGNLFIWDKKTTQLVNILHGDDEIVNVVTGHPYEPKIAVSGIDYTVKIFSPDIVAQRQFLGLPVENDTEEDGKRASGSRKRMQDSYTITSQNEAMTESGLQEAVHTRAMLSLLAGRLRERRSATGEDTGEIHINAEQDCNIM